MQKTPKVKTEKSMFYEKRPFTAKLTQSKAKEMKEIKK